MANSPLLGNGALEMREYYGSQFRADLATFMGASAVPYFGHAWSRTCAAQLALVPAERRPSFLICLYFTVLVDQAMYTHFPDRYAAFQALTRYPKFCHGLSQFQHNPRAILATPVDQGLVDAEEIRTALSSGMTLFVDEVIDFFSDHMPDVTATVFFDALLTDPDVQIPEILVMVDPTLKADVVVLAYRELRAAVRRAPKQRAG